MRTLLTAGEWDLCTLAGIVSDARANLPAEEGLPPSLLSDLKDQIRCDAVMFAGMDSGRQAYWFGQAIPAEADAGDAFDQVHWEHYWDCKPCSYPDRTGDLRAIVKIADFYSSRQWHSTGMYSDVYRPQGLERELQLCLPSGPRRPPGPGEPYG